MKLLELLGITKKRTWQELVGMRPHMIDPMEAEAGYGKCKPYEVEGRIAIIDVRGMLINDEEWWDGYGCSTYDRIAEQVEHAAESPDVDGILLRINSPGGECDKVFETAAALVSASKVKPMWAVADTAAFSAGYLLACCGSRIYTAPYSGGVGSIGIYSVHMDYSEYLAEAGIKPTFVEAGKGKTDGHPYKPLSASAQARMQDDIERIYGTFVDHVATQRAISAGAVRELGAALFHGSGAVEAGLADKIGSTDAALADMRAYLDSRASATLLPGFSSQAASAAQEEVIQMPPEEEIVAPAEAAAVVPDPVVEARAEAARRDAILAHCATAQVSVGRAQDFIASTRTAEQVGEELLAARAAASDAEPIVSQLQPHTGAGAEAANINQSAIVKAAERLAQAGKDR